MFGTYEFPDGKLFIDYIEEFIEFQKAFMRVMEQIREKNVITFPVVTYSLVYREGKFVDEEFARWCSNHNIKNADANFMISESTGVMASCCRLLNDTSQRKGFINSIGGGDLGIGSVSVVTLNLAGLAYQSTSKEHFMELVKEKTLMAIKINDVVRTIIQRNIEKGLLPQYDYDLINMDGQLSTIGINGVAEAAKHYGLYGEDGYGYHNYTDEGIEFAAEVLDLINDIKDEFECDYSMNIEQVPAEGGAVKLAAKNHLLYGSEEYITANQWIPLRDKATLKARAAASGLLDAKCGGGCIMHAQLDAPFNTEEQAWDMLNYIAAQGVIYFAFNLKINVDAEHHTFTTSTCPICGSKPVDTYQRIVGYLVPTSSWSHERRQELSERDWMGEEDLIL